MGRNWALLALLPLAAAIAVDDSNRNLRGQHQQVLSARDAHHHTVQAGAVTPVTVTVLTQNMASETILDDRLNAFMATPSGHNDQSWLQAFQASAIVAAAVQEQGRWRTKVKEVMRLAWNGNVNAPNYHNFVVKTRGVALAFSQELRVSVRRSAITVNPRNVVKGQACEGKGVLRNKCVMWVSIPINGGQNILILAGHLPMKGTEGGAAAGNLQWRLGEAKRLAEFGRVKALLVARGLWIVNTWVIFTGDTNFRYDPVREQLSYAMTVADGPFYGFTEGPPTHFTCRFGAKPRQVTDDNYALCRKGTGDDYTITLGNEAAWGNKFSWTVANAVAVGEPEPAVDAIVARSKAHCWSINHWRPMSRCDRVLVRPAEGGAAVTWNAQTSYPLMLDSDHNVMVSNFVISPDIIVPDGRFVAIDSNPPAPDEGEDDDDNNDSASSTPPAELDVSDSEQDEVEA